MSGQAVASRARVGRHWAFLSFLAGLAAGTGQMPLGLPVLAFPAFAAMIWLVATAPGGRSALLRGWLAGLGYFGATLFWIVEPFLVDAARHGWMAPFALVLLALGMGMFWALSARLAFALGTGVASRGLVFAVALVLAGLIRSYALTGFPWALPAYIWSETPVIQLTAWTGVHGLGLLTFLAAALPTLAGTARARVAAGVAAVALVGAGWALGMARMAGDAPAPMDIRVRLIQPNAAQHLKWKREHIPVFFGRNLSLTAEPSDMPPDLVIWPETAVPWLLGSTGGALDEMRAAAGEQAALVFGIQRRDGPAFHNSLAVADGPGEEPSVIYDKHHLVPFGEYLPFDRYLSKLGLSGIAAQLGGGYRPGPGPQVIDIAGRGLALPLICYEAVFPQDVFRMPERPDYLLHITNDAWFGKVAGPYQHLAQSRVRAIEQGLPMLRAANTGVSAVIDAHGRVLTSLPLGVAGKLDAVVPGALPPTIYSRLRDVPVVAVVLLSLLVLAGRRRRQLSR